MHASASKGTPRSLSSLRASVASSLRGFHHSRPGRPAELFCLAWMLPAWIVFELIGTKLPHYTMPLYPAVALMSARMVLAVAGRVTKRRIDTLGSVLWVTFGFGLTIVPWILPDLLSFFHAMEREDGFQSLYLLQVIARVCALALLVGITGVVVLRQLRRDHYVRVHAFAVLLAIVSWGFMFTRLVPDFAGLSRQLSSRLKECDPASSRNLATCEYQEDSLIFLSRGRIERVPLAHLEAWAERHPGGCVIMRAEDAIRPVARGTLIEVEGKDLHTFGYNYSIGRREHLTISEVPTK